MKAVGVTTLDNVKNILALSIGLGILDDSAGSRRFFGAKERVVTLIQATGALDDETLAANLEGLKELFFDDLWRRQLKYEAQMDDAYDEVEILEKAGDLDDETKEEVRQFIANMKNEARWSKRARRTGPDPSASSSSTAGATSAYVRYCSQHLKGNCHNASCPDPHLPKKDIPCPFLAKGSCTKGFACDWKH